MEQKKHRILRRKEVEQRTGLSRSTIYERMATGGFPQPIPLGGRAVGWLENEVDAWLDQQVTRARANKRTTVIA